MYKRQVQGLVVNVLDSIAIFTNIIIDMFIAPDRPGVRHKQYFRVVTPHIQRFVQILGPLAGVAGFRAAQSVEVVQGMRCLLYTSFGSTALKKRWKPRSAAVNTPSCSPHDVDGKMTSAADAVLVIKMS